MNNFIEARMLVLLMGIGYYLNFLCGVTGSFFPPESYAQMTIWQIGDPCIIPKGYL